MTNADRIRAMSDEDLAEWFISIQNAVVHYFQTNASEELKFPAFRSEWLDWLKKEN